MPRSCLNWSAVIICGLAGAYAAVIATLAGVGSPLPPSQINSIVAGTFAASAVVALVRRPVVCACSQDLAEMRQELRELREVARKLEEFESLPMELSAYMNDAAQLFELGREAERQRLEGDEGSPQS